MVQVNEAVVVPPPPPLGVHLTSPEQPIENLALQPCSQLYHPENCYLSAIFMGFSGISQLGLQRLVLEDSFAGLMLLPSTTPFADAASWGICTKAPISDR